MKSLPDIWKSYKVSDIELLAPLVSIVQSSGTGKSRTALELSSHNLYVVYTNFNFEGQGWHPKSPIVESINKEPLESTRFYASYILACIESASIAKFHMVDFESFKNLFLPQNLQDKPSEIWEWLKMRADYNMNYLNDLKNFEHDFDMLMPLVCVQFFKQRNDILKAGNQGIMTNCAIYLKISVRSVSR